MATRMFLLRCRGASLWPWSERRTVPPSDGRGGCSFAVATWVLFSRSRTESPFFMGDRRLLVVVNATVLVEVPLRIGLLRLMDKRVCIVVFLGAILANSGTKCETSAGRGEHGSFRKDMLQWVVGSDKMTGMICFWKYGAERDLIQSC